MGVNWFNLAADGVLIYAVIEAVAAARRVYDKRHPGSSASPAHLSQRLRPLPSESLLSPKPSEPNLLEPNLLEFSHDAESQSSPELATELATPSATDLDLPLAVSLSVSDVTQGTATGPVTSSLELNLVPPELKISGMNPVQETQPSTEHYSILAEIAELEQADSADIVAHLRPYLDHSDDGIRAATVFELGELVAKRQGAEAAEIAELLMQLGQDANPQVREQALIAWAKVQSIIIS